MERNTKGKIAYIIYIYNVVCANRKLIMFLTSKYLIT